MIKFSKKRFSKDKEDKILMQAKDHIKLWNTFYRENNDYFKSMINFINGEQWETDAKADYRNAGKIMLTFNKIRPYIRQLLGDDKKITVDIKIRNVGANNATDPQQENQMQNTEHLIGLVRNIAYHSNSLRIYNEGYTNAIEGGYGAWRVLVVKTGSVNNLRLEKITNPLNCFWDKNAKDPCKTDGEYAGFITYISKQEFKNRYPGYEYPDASVFTPVDAFSMLWGDEDKIAICEEYRREQYKVKQHTLDDGSTITDEQLLADPMLKERIESSENISKSRISHYKFTDHYLLEKSETPFEELPLIFEPGYTRIIDRQEKTFSFAHDARDPQRELNFIGSEVAEWLKITKKTKFMVPSRMIEKFIDDWNNPDHASTALRYDPDAAPGYKPETINPPPMPSDLVTQYQRAELDIQIALGRYEANIGAASNEKSGIAIFNRALEGNASLEEFRENRNYAIAKTGKIILNAIPKLYDTPRSITITDAKGKDKDIQINQMQFNASSVQHEMSQTFPENTYSIEVAVGPSFPMQKLNTAKMALELIKADPSGRAYGLLADKVAENLDVNNAYQIASRLRSLVPADILTKEDNPQQAQQQQQMSTQQAQQQQQLQQEMQNLQLQNAQLDLIAKKQEMMDNHMKAMSGHIEAMAKSFEAQTGRLESGQKAAVGSQKAHAEIVKSQNEALKSQYELRKQVAKDVVGIE